MPHKKNPIGSENLSGLMRIVCLNYQAACENLATCWHERSLDNSGSERVIVVDSSILVDYALARLTGIIEHMRVFPERMMRNIKSTKGLVFSQEVMMLLAEKSNLPREEVHTIVRNVALRCWEEESDFFEELLKEGVVVNCVYRTELQDCFLLETKISHVDFIFQQVFGDE